MLNQVPRKVREVDRYIWREIEREMEKGIKCRLYMKILNERQYSNTEFFTTTFIHCHKKYSLLNSIFPVLIYSVKVNDVVSRSFELFDTLGFGRVISLTIFCCNWITKIEWIVSSSHHKIALIPLYDFMALI